MEEKEPNPPPAIFLRRFELLDVDDMLEWVSDPLVSRYMTWETLPSREEALAYLVATILPHLWYRAVCLADGVDRCRAEVSCSLARWHWGRGIALVAVRMAVRDVFDELPQLERLDALVAVENGGAQRTLEKAGFCREGMHSRFRILDGKVRDMVQYCFVCAASKIEGICGST